MVSGFHRQITQAPVDAYLILKTNQVNQAFWPFVFMCRL